ncbi:MAG: hypothetical protein LBR72_01550 [Oscillospiraceae bacterium]|jgi:hypothetical protein|nr:hypothetical protein [Oscillospiraceae bacterium]
MSILLFLAVAAILAGAAVLLAKGQEGIIRQIAVSLCTDAERDVGGGAGPLKLSTVVGLAYPLIPAFIRSFLTEKRLVKIVEDALVIARGIWKEKPELLTGGAGDDQPP